MANKIQTLGLKMKIFISFSDLPILIQKNKIQFSDLRTGLFFFVYDLKQIFSSLPPKEEIQKAYKLLTHYSNAQIYEQLQRTTPLAARLVSRGDEDDFCLQETLLFAIQQILKEALVAGRLHFRNENASFNNYSFNSLRNFLISNGLSLPPEMEKEDKFDYFLTQREIYDLLKNHFDIVPLL